MWGISQKYGVKLTKLLRKNRMVRSETPEVGRILWLRRSRPAKHPVEFDDTFNELIQNKNIIAKSIDKNAEVNENVSDEIRTNDIQSAQYMEEAIDVSSFVQNADTITIQSDKEIPCLFLDIFRHYLAIISLFFCWLYELRRLIALGI